LPRNARREVLEFDLPTRFGIVATARKTRFRNGNPMSLSCAT